MSNGSQPTQQQAITAITVRGFKSLYTESCVEIRPLTILAGANSSGKSSIMQPLLLLKQTLEAPYDPGPLLLNGPNIQFTRADQFLSHVAGKRPAKIFTCDIGLDNRQSLKKVFRKQQKSSLDITEMRYQGYGKKAVLTPQMTHAEISTMIPQSALAGWASMPPEVMESTKIVLALRNEIDPQALDLLEWRWTIARTRCFLNLALSVANPSDIHVTVPLPINMLTLPFEVAIRSVIHVPGLRGNPERTYKTTAVGSTFPGKFSDYIASIINHWAATTDKRLNDLSDAAKKLGLTSGVIARQVDDTQVELLVGRLAHSLPDGSQDMVSIADVGFGVSQALPILVALLAAEPGQLVYLEQPEIHLHPLAQRALAEVLADAARRGVRVVAETHSSLLLLGVQTLVAEGKLPPDLVKLHWFTRGEDGKTRISSADLDENGAFGEWPEDFGMVELDAQSRYLD